MLIIFEGTDTTVDPFHWKTLLTFSLSVLSAAFGMSRFFNVGPCRLVPYGKMNVGFIFLVISIATCLVGKGFALALAGGATKNHKGNFMAAISLWIGLSLVPQLLFVRIFLTKILEKKLSFGTSI